MAHAPTYTLIAAAESTGNVLAGQRVRDVGKGIAYVDPDAAPLTVVTMLGKDNTRVVFNSKYEWTEKEMLPPRLDQVDGAATTGETTVTVDNGGYFTVDDIVRVVPTGELLLVTAISTNQLTVTRSFGDASGTAAATIANNADLFILSNAKKEGASVETPKSHQPTQPHNFTQIIYTPFGATGTEMVSENYTGPDRPRQRKEGAIEHRVDIERTFLFGERNEDVGDTAGPRRSTGGFQYFATKNSKDYSGTVTEPELEDHLQDIFAHTGASSTRTFFASPLWLSIFDGIAGARQQVVPRADTFGVAITRWVTAHGELNIVKHPLLVNGVGGTGYEGYGFIVDPKRVKFCHLRERNTKLHENQQAPGDDKYIDAYRSECGFQLENPAYHGTAKGATG